MNDKLKVSGRDHGLTEVLCMPGNEMPAPSGQEAGWSQSFYRTQRFFIIHQENVTRPGARGSIVG